MTVNELTEGLISIQREANNKQDELRKQFAKGHNTIKVGDIITDHYHTIKVERMNIYGHPVPFMRYYGIELTKKGDEKKRQPYPQRPMLQTEVRIVNGKPYRFTTDDLK